MMDKSLNRKTMNLIFFFSSWHLKFFSGIFMEKILFQALLLEDLAVKEFSSMKKAKGSDSREAKIMDFNHALLALKCLGKFHANSFIIRKKRPDVFEKLREIQEPLFARLKGDRGYTDLMYEIVQLVSIIFIYLFFINL